MRKYDFAVFIGRFQPFHDGHKRVIEKGLEIADKVIVLVGSSNSPRTTRNPFNYVERHRMIRNSVVTADRLNRVEIYPLPDSTYNEQAWIERVQTLVGIQASNFVKPRVALIGNERDFSSYYLRLFPQWTHESVSDCGINATAIRKRYLAGEPGWQTGLPEDSADYLEGFRQGSHYAQLVEEAAFFAEYREKWGEGPHLTVDAMVVQAGHVLLVERGSKPGVGLMALPGGHLEKNETLLSGALRELDEETMLLEQVMVEPFLRAQYTFDDPHRSQRGRVITTAFLFALPADEDGLPSVKGGDDAARAEWVPLAEVRTERMFEDHAHIITKMLGYL